MALMSPFQQAFNVDTNLTFAPPQLQLDTNSYSGATPSGETTQPGVPSQNYTPPNNSAVLSTQQQAQQQAQLTAKALQDQQAQQQSPYGMSPSNVGNIAGKIVNGGFSNQVNAINKFGSEAFGFMSPDTSMALSAGLSGGDAAALGSSAGFVNAAGDSVSASALPWGADAIAGQVGADGAVTAVGADAGLGVTSGGMLGGASFTGVLGAAGIGALGGGMLAKALGENPLGGSIGGGIGAAAGMAFGAAGAAALGLELGAFAGPLGAVVGGVGGALIGGLFGNHSTPTNASGYNATFNSTGNITSNLTGGKNPNGVSASTVSSTANNFSQILQAASQQLGIKIAPNVSMQANYSSQHGGANFTIQQNGQNVTQPISFNQNDPSSINAAYQQGLQTVAQLSGYTNTDQLNSWFNKMSQGSSNGNQPPSAPSIPVSQSFADFVNSKQGTSNAGNGSAAPTVPAAH